MTKPTSLVTFLLDRSGSMSAGKASTIEGFNGYLAGLKAETEAQIDFTFLQFDSQSLDKVCVAIPVAEAVPLTDRSFQPRGGTPLIDAAVKTIRAVEASMEKRDDTPRVVICIQTDGQENESRQHTWEELRALIFARRADGWEFNFLGAGIDAYAQGARMGIAASHTMSYDRHRPAAVGSAFRASAENATSFSAGRTTTASYSARQRMQAGDRFAPGGTAGVDDPAAATAPLDLSPGAAAKPVARQALPDDLVL